MTIQTVSQVGLDLIKEFEGCSLTAYADPASGGVPYTIGFGHTKGVKPGDTINQSQADAFLLSDATTVAALLRPLLNGIVVTQNQFDALVSFSYNLGIGTFAGSTMLKYIRGGNWELAANEFNRFIYGNHKVLNGLVARRAAERALFIS
jgi:lysozyme